MDLFGSPHPRHRGAVPRGYSIGGWLGSELERHWQRLCSQYHWTSLEPQAPCNAYPLVARLFRARGTIIRYNTQAFVDGKLVFESHIMGVVF